MIQVRLFRLIKFAVLVVGIYLLVFVIPNLSSAYNINRYSDTISTSAPSEPSNHTLDFILDKDIAPGSYIEIIPPSGFEILGTSTFSALRNVQLIVNGVHRNVGPVQSATNDLVEITAGSPGKIRYTLNSTIGITAGSNLVLKIGDQTSTANKLSFNFSTSTGTTTTPADIKPIVNGSSEGTYSFDVRVYDGGEEVADAGFVIALINSVGVGPVDTTETIPPERFNGAPTGTLSGTTFSVELSLETNEFAFCRYSQTPGTDFNSMSDVFSNTGLIFHTTVVIVVRDALNKFYVRCIDDEGNYNIDDYVIQFAVNATPTGSSNTTGSVSGDGSGTGNSGTGSGSGGGGTTGGASGGDPTAGAQSGNGGSGGGSGGGGGSGSGSGGGGGFENTAGPYRSGDAQVNITGYTSPRSTVTALVDGKIVTSVQSGANGEFSILIQAIARGAYTFGIYSVDVNKVKSYTFSTSFTVTGARESSLSNILIVPSILVAPDPVTPGSPVVISGYAIPNSTVSIETLKDGNGASLKQLSAVANASGAFSVSLDTTGFAPGTYKVRAKSQSTFGNSNFSAYTVYGVGQAATRGLSTDLNTDGKVNLVDFSILLFWWNTNGGTSNPSADINSDGKVSLTDFSILLFNWTG